MHERLIGKDLKKLFIIGAGASADAGLPTSKDLFREVIFQSIKDDDGNGLEYRANRILKRIKTFYPNFEFSVQETWPNFEQYLDLVYNICKTKAAGKSCIDYAEILSGLNNFCDTDANALLYWFLFTSCMRWAGHRTTTYLKVFLDKELKKEITNEIAVINLNYEWLFERAWLLSYNKIEPEKWGDNNVHVTMSQIYQKNSEFALFKPHGSANLVIVNKNDEIIIQDNIAKINNKLPILNFFAKYEIIDERGEYKLCYCGVPIDADASNFVTKLKDLIPAMIPPFGIKGATDPSYILQELSSENPIYEILLKHLKEENSGSIDSILNVKEEIWLVGTSLIVDPYLFDQLRIKKALDKNVKIKFLSPDENAARELSTRLGEIEFYKGTLASYSSLIEQGINPTFKKL